MLTLRTLLASGLVLTALAFGSPALACKCAPHSVAQAMSQADAVFEGRVLSIADVNAGGEPAVVKKRVTLSIVRVWKDLEDVETVSVTTNAESASCGFPFELNKSYLVYANRSDQVLSVHSCTRTRAMADAGEDLSQLGGGVTPVRITPAVVDAGPLAPAPSASPETTKPPKRGGCAVSQVGPLFARAPEGAPRTGFAALAFVALALLVSSLARRRARFDRGRIKRS